MFKPNNAFGKGILLATCTQGKESRCLDELETLLNAMDVSIKTEFVSHENATLNESQCTSFSVEEEIERELKNLAGRKFYRRINSKCKGICFMLIAPERTPLELTERIYNYCLVERITPKYICQLIPLSRVCSPKKTSILKAISSLEDSDIFGESLKPETHENKSFFIRLRRRGNTVTDRKDFFECIGKIMKDRFGVEKVDLGGSGMAVLIEFFHNAAGVAIVKEGVFKKLGDFSLKKFQNLNM